MKSETRRKLYSFTVTLYVKVVKGAYYFNTEKYCENRFENRSLQYKTWRDGTKKHNLVIFAAANKSFFKKRFLHSKQSIFTFEKWKRTKQTYAEK